HIVIMLLHPLAEEMTVELPRDPSLAPGMHRRVTLPDRLLEGLPERALRHDRLHALWARDFVYDFGDRRKGWDRASPPVLRRAHCAGGSGRGKIQQYISNLESFPPHAEPPRSGGLKDKAATLCRLTRARSVYEFAEMPSDIPPAYVGGEQFQREKA